MQEARDDGAPPEFIAILNQILTSKTGAPGFPKNAVTDDAGRFSFPDVPAGNYMLTAEREGFFGTSARGTNARSKTVSIPVLVTTRPAADLVLSLTPGGRINGQLRDEKGAPLPNVTVQAFTRAYQNGAPVLQPAASRTTNDRGEFRLFWLEPGDYFVAATPRPATGVNIALTRETRVITFHPATTNYADAVVVRIRPGEEANGIDVAMRAASVVRLSGQILGLPTSTATAPPGSISTKVEVLPVGSPFSGDLAIGNMNAQSANGLFDIQAVRPGSYEIVVHSTFRTADATRNTNLYGRLPISVGSQDVENLRVSVQPGIEVQARVSVVGGTLAALKDPVSVGLQPDGPFESTDNEGASPKPTSPDGSIRFPNIQPGDYKVRAFGFPPNAYVADIRQAGASIYTPGLRVFGKEPEPIEISIALDAGAIEGAVVTSDQKPAASTTVVLVPTSAAERANSERYKIVTADQQGRFKVTGIAPGLYKVFAWQTLPLGAHQSPEFLAPFEAQGASVDVKPSSSNTVRVVLIQN
jgi:hypothetical protein